MSLQTIVQNAPLPKGIQQSLLNRISEEGETPEVTQAVRESLQEYINSGFKKLDVHLDPNDPKVQAVTSQLNASLDDVEANLQETLENLSIDAAVAQAKANKNIDAVEIEGMRAKMAA